MRVITVTGVEIGPNGKLFVRVIVKSRRWWQLHARHTAATYYTTTGEDWFHVHSLDMAPRYMKEELTRAARAAWDSLMEERDLGKHAGYGRAAWARFSMGPIREASAPRSDQ